MFLRLWPSEKLVYLPIEDRHIESILLRTRAVRSNIRNTQHKISEKSTKMPLSRKSLAGPGYIILNGIRVANIISLLAIIAASILMLVKTSTASKFFFFDAVMHLLTAMFGMFLIVSETNLFRRWYASIMPLLSEAHGFVTLAGMMIVLGFGMLANLSKPATSKESLGLPFWRCVIASGIVITIFGVVNLIASFVFRDRANGITARQVRAHGAVAASMTPKAGSVTSSTPSAPELAQSYIHNNSTNADTPTRTGNPFRMFNADRRQSVLPSYHTASSTPAPTSPPYPQRDPVSPTSRYSRATACTRKKVFGMFGNNKRDSLAPPLPVNPQQSGSVVISGPIGVNPQFAHLVQRPDSALHPSRTGESDPYRWKTSS